MATSFSGGGSRNTQREPSIMGKQLVIFITCVYVAKSVTIIHPLYSSATFRSQWLKTKLCCLSPFLVLMIQYTSITYIFFHFFSRCVILISSILPRGNSTLSHKTSPSLLQNLNNKAKYVNECLQTITNSNRSIHFIDNSDLFLQDGRVNRQLLSRDDLHLSFSGTSTLVRSIVAHVNRLLPNVKTTTTTSNNKTTRVPETFRPLLTDVYKSEAVTSKPLSSKSVRVCNSSPSPTFTPAIKPFHSAKQEPVVFQDRRPVVSTFAVCHTSTRYSSYHFIAIGYICRQAVPL